ncbi:MAG: ABC transporter ATP-binding protein [Chloroflexota bacterium]|nr:ABC transporter ATP-binding protein [Chloroflexota bacterium]
MSRTASPSASAPSTSRTGQPAIETRHLHKVYGHKVAVHDLDLAVEPGEVFGFLGPNGAGKTTTVKILLGLVRATRGEARIFGQPAGQQEARRRIGYLPEHFRFHDWLTGEGLLDFHGRLAGLSPEQRRARIPAVLDLVGLTGRGGDRLRGYSKGMTQRIGLAQAIIHEPDLVLLDEPTSALDPVGRREVRDLIRALRARGMTVFLNSHLLSEVELVCDHVAIVDRGQVVRSGRLSDLVGVTNEIRLTLDRLDSVALALLPRYGRVLAIDHASASVTLAVDHLGMAPELAEAVIRAGYRLFGLVPTRQSLEDVFVSLVRSTSDR